ncbi:MAG: hypothetical protein HRU41_07865 [Saprospiraceae bacterium]|nr:hypothetical protein [Saprospiraceae bacterium]
MDREEELFDRIELYLRDEMTPKDKLAFEQEIEVNPALKEQVDKQQLQLDAIEVLLESDLREQMKEWQVSDAPGAASPKQESPGRVRRLYRIGIGIAAAILILLVFRVLLDRREAKMEIVEEEKKEIEQQEDKTPIAEQDPPQEEVSPKLPDPPKESPAPQPSPPTPQVDYIAIATRNYQLPQDLQGTLRSTEEEDRSPLDAGLAAFEDKNYSKAISELRALATSIGEDEYARAQEILGHAYFLNKDYTEAAQVFEELAKDPDYESVRQYGEWYLLLSLLPQYERNKDRIDGLLNKIVDPEEFHNYRQLADALQLQLK